MLVFPQYTTPRSRRQTDLCATKSACLSTEHHRILCPAAGAVIPPQLRAVREEIFVPAQCTTCTIRHACDQCAALCYAETGSFTEVPTYMCDRTRAYLALIGEELRRESDG